MGAAGSVPATAQDALAAGFSQKEIDSYQAWAKRQPKMQLHYWGAASRAHYPMFVAGAAGKAGSIDCVRQIPYPGTDEFAKYPHKSYLGQLPYLIDGPVKMGESMAICRYFARKFGSYEGATNADFAASEQMISWSGGMHGALTKAQYAPDRTVAMDAAFAAGGHVHKNLAVAEGLITVSGFFGQKIFPGDCTFAASLDLILKLEPEILAAYPKCKALYDKVLATGDVKKVTEMYAFPYFKRKSDASK